MEISELKDHAKNIRVNILKEVANAKSGHPGGSLGAADLITELFFEEMDLSADNASSKDRDRFVLSKGHTSPMLYAALAEKGIIPEEELMTFRRLQSRLQGHPDMNDVDGIDMSTGSLGQGFAAAVGMALPTSWKEMITASMHCLVMVNVKKARSGKLRWQLPITTATICVRSSMKTVCRSTVRIGCHRSGSVWIRSLKPLAGMCSVLTDMTMNQIKAAFDEARRQSKARPTCDHCQNHQGQGCLLYGESGRLAWKSTECGADRSGAERTGGL